ncbi:hypothetical protein ACIS_01003 [Anaplasma centrale str. Israel]|uniref:Uncharacterized protein n=1 Tax=Anaplasma centrale (strain Israel) TaxID=574556 RepID=D1ASN9_ANACI|nr:hypothetical protein [Anaplasma centrale]ACZ49492.1 hypothetical protein ACIS_01003 [Anaplasma centrale str. Israel]
MLEDLRNLWKSAARGAGDVGTSVKESSVPGSAWNALKVTFGLNLKNIARLDPQGNGEQQKVRVPVLMSQLMDRSQPCEFLPPSCFSGKGSKMRLEKGQLVIRGVSFPLDPIKADGRGLDRAVTHDGKLLYAINTNHQKKALLALGLDLEQYKNKRLVIACEGDSVVPPSEKDTEAKVMRAIYNAEVTAETRRIMNERNGATSWLLTITMAVPFNTCAAVLNFACMIPQGALEACARLLGAGAASMEREAQHRIISKHRGTVTGLSSPAGYMLAGFALRCMEKIALLGEGAIGSIRKVSVSAAKAIPILVNSAYNLDASQLQVGKQLLVDSGNAVLDCFIDGIKDMKGLGFYLDPKGEKSQSASARDGVPAISTEVGESQQDNSPEAKGRGQQKGAASARGANDDGCIVLSEADMLKVVGAGADLMSSGTTVSYGTSKGLRDIFVSARNRGHGAMK